MTDYWGQTRILFEILRIAIFSELKPNIARRPENYKKKVASMRAKLVDLQTWSACPVCFVPFAKKICNFTRHSTFIMFIYFSCRRYKITTFHKYYNFIVIFWLFSLYDNSQNFTTLFLYHYDFSLNFLSFYTHIIMTLFSLYWDFLSSKFILVLFWLNVWLYSRNILTSFSFYSDFFLLLLWH